MTKQDIKEIAHQLALSRKKGTNIKITNKTHTHTHICFVTITQNMKLTKKTKMYVFYF